jgi:3-dehydroquinate synthase
MLMAADLSARHGWLDADTVQRTERLLQQAGLPVAPPKEMDAAQFMQLMSIDKKVVDGSLRLVLLKALGDAIVTGDFRQELLSETLGRSA